MPVRAVPFVLMPQSQHGHLAHRLQLHPEAVSGPSGQVLPFGGQPYTRGRAFLAMYGYKYVCVCASPWQVAGVSDQVVPDGLLLLTTASASLLE